jgi:hypothetical protein
VVQSDGAAGAAQAIGRVVLESIGLVAAVLVSIGLAAVVLVSIGLAAAVLLEPIGVAAVAAVVLDGTGLAQ